MARPSKWTEQLQSEIVTLVEAGDAAEVAAGVKGIGRSTHFEWMSRNEDYRIAITRACDVFESNSRAIVLGGDEKGSGFGPAKAALEVLGRRIPKRWSPTMKVELAESLNRYIDVAQRVLAAEDFAKLLEALAEEPGEGEAPSHPQPEPAPIH